MIKFFRKIRQRLLTENKFSKYLIYAIGEIILVVIGILIGLSSYTAGVISRAADHPNIIFIMADDLGYGDLGCYGQQVIKTPRLDQMAAEGMRFKQFYAGCPVCAPSRSVLMTGLHTGHTHVRGNAGSTDTSIQSLRNEDVTVAELLKPQNYHTALIGKWGLGEVDQPGFPLRQGFDYFYGTPSSNDAFVDLYRNNKLIEEKADMSTLTKRNTDEVIA